MRALYMAFDPQLQRALDAAAARFRDDMVLHTQAIVDDLQASARVDRERAVAEARETAEREVAERLIAAVAEARVEAHRAGREEGRQEGIKEGINEGIESGRISWLKEGFEAGRAEGLQAGREESLKEGREEGLKAGREDGLRAGREEGREEGWGKGREEGRKEGREAGRKEGVEAGRNQGMEAGQAAGRAEALEQGRAYGAAAGREEGFQAGRLEGRREMESDAKTAVAHAVATARAGAASAERAANQRLLDAVRTIGRAHSLSGVFDALAACAVREAAHAAVLLVEGQRVRGWRDNDSHGAPAKAVGPTDAAVREALRTNLKASGPESQAFPMSVGGQVVALLYADADSSSVALEVLACHAERCLEAVTAFKTARLLTAYPELEAGEPLSAAGARESAAEDTAAARRYARLLVSEIKLYHEADVAIGQRMRDLSTRLGGEIARARALYEQRVPPHLRQTGDPFRDELVRTLANGDETLLATRS